MNMVDYLDELSRENIMLWPDGNNLLFNGPEQAMTPARHAWLTQHKTELLEFLCEDSVEHPLSYEQKAIWFEHQAQPEGFAHNLSILLRIHTPVESVRISNALQLLMNRHPVLRTFFYNQVGQPIQRVYRFLRSHLILINTIQDTPQLLREKIITFHQQAFNLAEAPAWRATLFTGAEQQSIFLLTIHRLICDSQSIQLLIDELRSLLAGTLLPLPIATYQDYQNWQNNTCLLENEKNLAYWKENLAGELAPLNLPTDHFRHVQAPYQEAVQLITLPKQLSQQLQALAHQESVTLYVVLLAAFQLLLHRYTGQSDIRVGTMTSGRHKPEFSSVIGYCINPIVMRTNFSKDVSFRTLIQQVQITKSFGLQHQNLPFSILLKKLQTDGIGDINVLFQTVFSLQKYEKNSDLIRLMTVTDKEPLSFGNLSVSSFSIPQAETLFELSLELYQLPDQLIGTWKYAADLFESSTICRMIDHFKTLLASVVADPEQTIAALPFIPETEVAQLQAWNQTTTDYPRNKTIVDLFEDQVANAPDNTAIIFQNQTLSYKQLNIRANQIAYYLRSLVDQTGVSLIKPDTLVGICVERSLDMMIGLLGILKAGAAYVPLDPHYPEQRIQCMLNDSQVSVLITQKKVQVEKYLSQVATVRKIIYLDHAENFTIPSTKNVKENITPDHLAYVLYTSGSTGQPKGVMIPHRGLTNIIYDMRQRIRIQPKQHMLALTTLGFDIAGLELYLPLVSGATIQLVDREVAHDPSKLHMMFSKHPISVVQATPATWMMLLEYDWQTTQPLTILCGGEALNPALGRKLLTHSEQLWNVYGPTEATIWSTTQHITENTHHPEYIGQPIANTQIYILDNQHQLVPIGIPGELCIAGDGLARGYLNQPELTAEKFIQITLCGKTALIYKTGDLARWLPDGNLEYLGRIDNQIKLRGFRIELGEIEATLTLHPYIKEAVVVAREDQSNDKQLVGYLVADQVDTETQVAHVEQWQTLYEQTYSRPKEQEDLTFDISVWNSSYTRQPIPEKEMREWVDSTITDIRRLRCKRILEIGCGTGLLLSQLAPDCDLYWGADCSQEAIQQLEHLKESMCDLQHVILTQRTADDFTGIPNNQFDGVVLNSVIQYFPSVDYLLKVLENAVRIVRPGGKIYVGDVLNLRLLKVYHTMVQAYQAPDDLLLEELDTRIQQRLLDEEELFIDPDFFYALEGYLPQIAKVEIQLKRGHYINELTQFRYQVVLHLQEQSENQPTSHISLTWIEKPWSSKTVDIDTLTHQLDEHIVEHPDKGLVIRNIPNRRIQEGIDTLAIFQSSHQQLENVAQLRTHLAQQPQYIHPETLWTLSETASVKVYVTWSETSQAMDVCMVPNKASFIPYALPASTSLVKGIHKPWYQYANNPLLGKLNRTLVPKVRTWLGEKLPDYMMPSAFVILDTLPLTPNGKVDRKALPDPLIIHRTDQESFVSPSTKTEIALANIWSELLKVEQPNLQDDFFHLGGHSLLATQCVAQIRELLSIELPLLTLFDYPTLGELANWLDQHRL